MVQPITFTKSSRVQQFFELGLEIAGELPQILPALWIHVQSTIFPALISSPPILISQLCSQFLSLSLSLSLCL